MKKVLYTLCVDNYAPEITSITFPLLKHFAHKIGASFQIIEEKRFPDWPVTYNKLALHELAKNNDWSVYVDADALIHPDFFDVTDHLSGDTVAFNGQDLAGNRFRYDRFFRRDGRHVGACNWFCCASELTAPELWKPLDDLTLAEALENIFPTAHEASDEDFIRDVNNQQVKDENGEFKKVPKPVITREHLIDDYVLSRNIAKFGLKHTTIMDIQRQRRDTGNYLWHAYTISVPEKVRQMREVMKLWSIENFKTRG